MQTDTGLALQVEVRDAQVGDLLHAGAGVVEQQQQSTVTEGGGARGRQSAEDLGDLLLLKETSLGRGGALDGDRGDALCHREQLGAPLREKVEEGLQDRESMVAGAPVVVPFLLQMQQETLDPLGGQVRGGELRQPTSPVRCSECEKKT